ncbi:MULTISPECIES: cell division ATP-binding protein FtsE [Megasphaera]|jgi:cell division transport system ATP-binding protein|uniref:Cell division ATP-binding protein FtsE n=2 Tax=Megasphaera TaxID=906 RepID=A0ABV1CW59_9FIRM|nr:MULTISPECIES: cell division ATP-binding protein FtsE [unclassified Megasphaera]MCH3903294.1 cell division ATP-binding protein FtsE [Limosilactobacillus oris]MCI1887927.1 cell division ATP-binding protein FtsE [Sporolactobacillus sp.]MCI1905737.1 cell division ATP-binding protein FtsE [Enterococcaceae bacterium]EPP16739.1 cell division ATP-binding protein FtsE [Megasphaera sp. NM10]EPP17464.1 cell division ATP-binding protein FtsE [Megasphaera sp. BL7]
MIELKNVSKVYDNGSIALDHVSLHIGKGEFVFVVGASGAGKSTLIKLLSYEELPSRGSVFVNGIEVNKLAKNRVPYLRRKMGIVFQDFRLLPNKTAQENVAFAMEVIEAPRRLIRRRVRDVLDLVGLVGKADALPKNLSGGEQQRVAIARAIVNRPLLLIADEPTGNLDPETSRDIMEVFKKINHMGTTVLMVTHDKTLVDMMNKRVIEIDGGKVVRDEQKGGYDDEN